MKIEWIFFSGRDRWTADQRAAHAALFNVLSPHQLAASDVRELAFWTGRKISSLNFGNLTGEIETAMREAVRKFDGRRRKE